MKDILHFKTKKQVKNITFCVNADSEAFIVFMFSLNEPQIRRDCEQFVVAAAALKLLSNPKVKTNESSLLIRFVSFILNRCGLILPY